MSALQTVVPRLKEELPVRCTTHDTVCDAARPVFPYPYRPTGDDVVRLRTIYFLLYSELKVDDTPNGRSPRKD